MARKPFNPDLVQTPPGARTPAPKGPVTVSQVTAMVRQAIESALPPTIHVIGEVSNFKRHSSGHLYLTLKDRFSELSCVMWRSAAAKLKFAPDDGLEVIATGNIEVFERTGRYQLYIRKLEPRGEGALDLAFRQLCEKLSREGLFDEQHKKPLPPYPQRIVLITSPTGAAIADMLRTIDRRYPCVETLVFPVRVQGAGAAEEIAHAIQRVNACQDQLGGIDLIIVGRGGGSLEDLWAFNEEIVVRAIHAGTIPIISAVGHEVDVTVADLVADVRAATPTAAAEIAVPVLEEVLEDLASYALRAWRAVSGRLDLGAARLEAVVQRAAFRQPLAAVHRREQIVDELANRLQHRLVDHLRDQRLRLDQLEPTVRGITPHAFLMRTAVMLRDLQHRLRWSIWQNQSRLERMMIVEAQRLDRRAPTNTIQRLSQRLDQIAETLPAAMCRRLSFLSEHVAGQNGLLAALSYKSVLGRGYSITRTKKGRHVLRSIKQVKDRDRIVTEIADGEFESTVIDHRQMELFE
ncbi:MAG: exodeoxyribonuclease VII large subunit [Phycisphaerales bacterium]|nr:MAG: exodeoxyribonuclease VII large subunit [Phycisphaerales bacterium]